MLADFGETARNLLQRFRTEAIYGERGRHQMLAKTPIGKRSAGALPGEFLPCPGQFATVNLRADDSRHDAASIERNDLDVPAFVIGDTPREDFLTGNVSQGGDIEPLQAGGCLDPVPGALRLSHYRRRF